MIKFDLKNNLFCKNYISGEIIAKTQKKAKGVLANGLGNLAETFLLLAKVIYFYEAKNKQNIQQISKFLWQKMLKVTKHKLLPSTVLAVCSSNPLSRCIKKILRGLSLQI